MIESLATDLHVREMPAFLPKQKSEAPETLSIRSDGACHLFTSVRMGLGWANTSQGRRFAFADVLAPLKSLSTSSDKKGRKPSKKPRSSAVIWTA